MNKDKVKAKAKMNNLDFTVVKPDASLHESLKRRVDGKTKPLGALGKLEDIAIQIGTILQTETPRLSNPHLLVFAGDHGIANHGVSRYPSEVTQQMVYNFLNGGAAINVFTKQHRIQLKIIDAGVNHTFSDYSPHFLNQKVRKGARNTLKEPAMTAAELDGALRHGFKIADEVSATGCNVVGFGEMGIGNTAAASLIMSRLTRLPLEECVGRGTGLDDEGLRKKVQTLQKVAEKHPNAAKPLELLQTFGGFEIAQMTAAMIRSAQSGMVLMIDGFVASAAFLAAQYLSPNIIAYAIFCHRSHERGHAALLKHINVSPILNLGMRLGEGTGCAVAYPIIQSAVRFLNEMADFDTAGVSKA